MQSRWSEQRRQMHYDVLLGLELLREHSQLVHAGEPEPAGRRLLSRAYEAHTGNLGESRNADV